MAELFLEIITPAKVLFSGNIKSITVPGTAGSFQVLVNHAPILSTIETGVIKVGHPDGKTTFYATGGGTIEVKDNKILLLADSLEDAAHIDAERARQSKERAVQRLQNRADNNIDVQRAEASLKRALNRLDLIEKKMKSEV